MTNEANIVAGPKENLRALRILCAALIGGTFVFAMLITGLVLVKSVSNPITGKVVETTTLWEIAVIYTIISMILSFTWYRKRIANVKNDSGSLMNKLNNYRSALILYMATSQSGALFTIIVLFLTGKLILMIGIALSLGWMFSKFPFTKKVIGELNLDSQEQQELQ